jgi:Uma2 family endonuclease
MTTMSDAQLTLDAPDVVNDEPLSVRPYRISVEKYHQMIEAGIFRPEDRIELLEGWLVEKMSKNPLHRFSTQVLRELLISILPSGWFADDQEPVTTANSEPEPDMAIIRGERRDYLKRHPMPHEIGLVVEIADISLKQDRRLKQRIYASAGIAAYWLLNLQERQLEVYTQPVGEGIEARYESVTIYSDTEEVPLILDDATVGSIKISDLLP